MESNKENIPHDPNYQGPGGYYHSNIESLGTHQVNPNHPNNCQSNYSSISIQNPSPCGRTMTGQLPYTDQRFASPFQRESYCGGCQYLHPNGNSPMPHANMPSHIYAQHISPNIPSPHTPSHAHTPEWVSGKNPWLMTPRHTVCSAGSYEPFTVSNVYPQMVRQNPLHQNTLQVPPLQYGPSIIHHPSPICQMPAPPAAPYQMPCENVNSNMYVRTAPPGFAQMNPVQESHEYQIQEKPAYATNLFNQQTVDIQPRRYNEPANVDQMEVAGVFWDIENCAVPHQKSAFALVQRIREKMFQHLREVEFMCACDAGKETKAVMDELNSAQVTIVHIKGTAKNAADEKLRQSIRRFADEHKPPATIILITGDVNFAPDISDLKNRKKYNVILIYPEQAPEPLRVASNKTLCYNEFIADLPLRSAPVESEFLLIVSNLPTNWSIPKTAIKSRLNQLFDNTGGKVSHVFGKSAVLKFTNYDMAKRALKRFDGEDVFGNKISIREKAVSCAEDEDTPRKKRGLSQDSVATYASAVGGAVGIKPKNQCRVSSTSSRENVISNNGRGSSSAPTAGIKLTITNIDAGLGEEGIRELLNQKISKTCQIQRLNVQPYNRFTMTADVIVPTMKDATNVLESCQRSRMGKKRILVTLTQQSDIRMNTFRANISYLIQDGNSIPMSALQYKYYEMYGDKDICTLENLRKLGPSFVKIQEPPSPGIWVDSSDVNIWLASPIRRRPIPQRTMPQSPYTVTIPHCDRHVQIGQPVADCSLRRVACSLREFAAKLHGLLASHHGILPLSSFDICWENEFGSFPSSVDSESGVYLEHLASFVPGVEIVNSQHSFKIISWAQTGASTDGDTDSASSASTSSSRPRAPLGDPQMVNFGRELTELLKENSGSSLPLNKLNSAFTKKFGRAPFRPGTPPIQQLSRLSHVVQVLGSEGRNDRILTLTHRAQVKRFTQETVKILKTLSDRRCYAHEYAALYVEHFKVSFRLDDFGVCELSDLLSDVPEGHLETTGEGPSLVISLPKKNRTVEEVQRTKKFGREVAELLRDCDKFSLPFTAFVPSYHHHFGRQCRLSNYGFSKLQDLFEAIPDIVIIEDDQNEKRLTLTQKERLSVLSEQMRILLRDYTELTIIDLPRCYFNQFHRRLEPSWFGELSINSLMEQLHTVLIVECCQRTKQIILRPVTPDNYENFNALRQDLLRTLFEGPALSGNNFIAVEQLQSHYEHFARLKFDSQRFAKTTGLTFQQISHRALEDFIDSDDVGGFHLNRVFFEARKLWQLIIEEENRCRDRKFHDKRPLPIMLDVLQLEYQRRYPGCNIQMVRVILDKLSPVLQIRSEGTTTTISTKPTRKEFRTAG